ARRPCDADPRSEIAPVVNVGLSFIAQSEAQSKISLRLPVIADECAQIELAARNHGIAGIDAELRGSSTEPANLVSRVSQALVEQRATIPCDGGDVLARVRTQPAAEHEASCVVLPRVSDRGIRAQAHSESPRVRAVQYGDIVLKFVDVVRCR